MKRRSHSKQPHEPHTLYLDEGISGDGLADMLAKAGLRVAPFEALGFAKNTRVADWEVIAGACKAGFVLVTKDVRLESDWIEDIIENKARVILLEIPQGNYLAMGSALICAQHAWHRALLDDLYNPLVIRVNRSGSVTKVRGAAELRAFRQRVLTARITRSKKWVVVEDRTNEEQG